MPELTPEQLLTGQYDTDDASHSEPIEVAPAPEKPRDPETGRFVPPKPQHHPILVRQAQDLGFSDEDINSCSPDELQSRVYFVNRDRLRLAQENRIERVPDRVPGFKDGDAPTTRPVQPAPEQDDLDLGEDYDPKIQNLAKELRATKQKLLAIEQRESQREVSAASERIDMIFDALPEQYKKLLGTGVVTQLDKTTYQRRIAVLQSAGVRLDNIPRNAAKLIQEAADSLFNLSPPGQAQPAYGEASAPRKPHLPKTDEELAQWNAAGLARPTSRDGRAEPKGERAAQKVVADWMRNNGGFDGGSDPEMPE